MPLLVVTLTIHCPCRVSLASLVPGIPSISFVYPPRTGVHPMHASKACVPSHSWLESIAHSILLPFFEPREETLSWSMGRSDQIRTVRMDVV